MILKELQQISLNKEMITVRRCGVDDDLTGTVLDANDEIIVMCLWADEGDFDGITVFELDQITEVLWGNREHLAIGHLVNKHGKQPEFTLEAEDFEAAIFELFEQYGYLALYHTHDEDSFDICSLEARDDRWLKIKTFGPKRTLSSLNKLVEIAHITRVTVNCPYQNNIIELHNTGL